MKLQTAVKRLEKDFGMVGVDCRIDTWERYQPTSFWLFTDKYFISVLVNELFTTNKGYDLQEDEFAKEQVDYLATKQPYVRLEISLRDSHSFDSKTVRFRIRNAQGFQNVLDKLDGLFTQGA